MTVHVSSHPLVLHKVTLLRDRETKPILFRQLMAEVASFLTYEATLDLPLETRSVETPLTTMTNGHCCAWRIGLVPILRAGLGMVAGAQQLIPQAEVWHMGLERDESTLQPTTYYQRIPDASQVHCCLVLDPMLATGGSAAAAVANLKAWGAPQIRYVGVLAAPEGMEALRSAHPDVDQYLGVVDERLTDDADAVPNGYIWPGLGDAGDRQFGTE